MKKDQVNTIRRYLSSEGFTNESLVDDLVDHIATECETLQHEEHLSFLTAFERAKVKLMPKEPYEIERDLKFLTTQKQNIMIKKIAYIGGYLSALCLCISILFTAKAYQDTYKAEKQREAVQMAAGISKYSSDEQREKLTQIHIEAADLKLNAIEFFGTSQALLIAAISIFTMTYLPFRFYNGYQKSELEFN